MKSKEDVLKSLAREYKLRQNYYAKQVAAGKMKQEDCDHELACTQSAIIMVRTYVEQPNEPLYGEFVQAYQTFAKKVLGLGGAPIGQAESIAIMSIIGKMRTMVAKGDEAVLATWSMLLTAEIWGMLNPFIQNQSTLVQIDKNIQEIIIKTKNAVAERSTNTGFASRFRPSN